MRSEYYVYTYREPNNPFPFYVGKGVGCRSLRHLTESKLANPTSKMLGEHLRQLLSNGTVPVIEIVANGLSQEEAFALEINLIGRYGRRDNGTGILLNLTDGGPGTKGRPQSSDAKRRISEANTGRTPSLETRKKLSAVRQGHPVSQETREKIRRSHIGIHPSFEVRQRLSNIAQNRSRSTLAKMSHSARTSPAAIEHRRQTAESRKLAIEAFDLRSGETCFTFASQSDAGRAGYDQGAVGKCARGQKPQYKGLGWRFVQCEPSC